VLDDVKNVATNYSTLLSAIKAEPGDGTIDTDAVVSQVKSIMVPTTTEILWGVISGDILSTAWERLTSNTGALLSLGFQQIAQITGTPLSQIFNFIGSGILSSSSCSASSLFPFNTITRSLRASVITSRSVSRLALPFSIRSPNRNRKSFPGT